MPTVDLNRFILAAVCLLPAATVAVAQSAPLGPNGRYSFGVLREIGVFQKQFAFADLDHDGDQDLVVTQTDDGVSVYLNDGSGVFDAQPDVYNVSNEEHALAIGDLDLDGHPDLIVSNTFSWGLTFLWGDGSGQFGESTQVLPASDPLILTLGDTDGDGDQDILVSNWSRFSVVAHIENLGDRRFGEAVRLEGFEDAVLDLADVTGDGVLDIITADQFAQSIRVHPGLGGGAFGDAIDSFVLHSPGPLATGDLDGDGDLDIVNASYSDDSLVALFNDGKGSFQITLDSFLEVAEFPGDLLLEDLDLDGDLDLVVASQVERVIQISHNDGQGGLLLERELEACPDIDQPRQPMRIGAADLDGNGAVDIGVLNQFYQFNNTMHFYYQGYGATCIADMNKDGQLNFFDISQYVQAYMARDLDADFTGNCALNFYDVSSFIAAFNAGCP